MCVGWLSDEALKCSGWRTVMVHPICVRKSYKATCQSLKLIVTRHRRFWDPFGARMQRLEHGAHLLAARDLSSGQGEQLEEGAQKECTVH